MADSVLHNRFDIEAYVQKRMLEISDPDERKLYKEVAEHMIVELHRQNQESLRRLETRVFDEVEPEEREFVLTMGMTERDRYDATDPILFPVFPDDLENREIPVQELLETLAAGQDYPLYRIYLQESYPVIKTFCETGRRFHGIVKTTRGEYKAVFRVEKNEEYKRKLLDLYHSFTNSGVSWNTVCAAYLHRWFTVSICSIQYKKPPKEITEVVIDFEEFDSAVRYHMVPLWNLELVKEKSSTYPVPCEDKINYEHRIFRHRLNSECSYLVAGGDGEINQAYRSKGDLVIIAPISMPQQWLLYKFNHGARQKNYDYPLLSNERKQSFTDSLTRMFHKKIRTQAGVAAIISSFPYDSCLIFKRMELLEGPSSAMTYDMDDFLTEEIAVLEHREKLCLYFQAADPDDYLNYDIMSFLVTHVQAAIPEYCCFGHLV